MRYPYLLLQIIIGVIVQAPVLWFAGRLTVGPEKAKFMDAVSVVTLVSIVNVLLGYFTRGEIA